VTGAKATENPRRFINEAIVLWMYKSKPTIFSVKACVRRAPWMLKKLFIDAIPNSEHAK
jgi:hypothetical protein